MYISVYILILFILVDIILFISMYRRVYNSFYMTNVSIHNKTVVYCVIYNSQINSIFIYGYSNDSKIDIYPCQIYYKNIYIECKLIYKYRIESYFMFEIKYNFSYYPRVVKIANKSILIQNGFNKRRRNTVCITKMINYSSSNYLIQMIELYRYFGITNFIVYYTSSSSSVLKILKYYHTLNILTLIKWNYSYETTFLKKYVYGQKWKYNDCYYRNVGNKGLIIFTDLDEIIWPVCKNNIRSMLYEYNGMKSDIYMFKSKIYLKEYSSITYDRYIHIVRDFDLFQIHNACVFPRDYVRKYIINGCNTLKIINIHDVERSVEHVKRSYVSENFGFVRHSRRVRKDMFEVCKNWRNYYDSQKLIEIIQSKVNLVKKFT